MPCSPEAPLSGPGGPGWGSGADRALGAGRNRAALCCLASVLSRRVRPPRVATAADPAPGTAGAVAPARARQPGPESGRIVAGGAQVVARAVDLCAGGRRGADQQRSGARPTAGGALAQGELWLG